MTRTKHIASILSIILLILLTASGNIQMLRAQDEGGLKGLLSRTKLSMWGQMGYAATWEGEDTKNSFEIRRMIIKADIQIDRRWSARMMFKPTDGSLQEAWLDYEVKPWLHIKAGQQKIAFGQETQLRTPLYELTEVATQSTRYLSGFGPDPLIGGNSGRDIGVKFWGEPFDKRIHYELALMNGQGINKKDGNHHKDLSGYLDVKPWDGVTLHGSFYLGKGHAVALSEANPDIQIGDDYKRDRIGFGVTMDKPYLFMRAGWQKGWDKSVQSVGAYVTFRRNLIKDVDAIAAVDYFNRNTAMGLAKTDYWAGLQWWFSGEHRIQAHYIYSQVKGGSCIHKVDIQLQFSF